jgi:hypothetical protein
VKITKPSVYSIHDSALILQKNKKDVQQILSFMEGNNSLPLVYETKKTLDLSYAGTMVMAKQKEIKAEVALVQKTSTRFVSLAKAHNPKTKITQFGAASYPITIRFSDLMIKHIVGRLAIRNAIEKVVPRPEVLSFIYAERARRPSPTKATNFH